MSLLTRGMYGKEFNPTPNAPFGLRCGQMRGRNLVHNGGWYDRWGNKLGWGDLSPDDFRRIAAEIPVDELFVVLGEQESFWEFVEKIGPIGSMSRTRPEIDHPGVEYMVQHAHFIIGRGRLYYIDRYKSCKETTLEWYGAVFEVVEFERVLEVLAAESLPPATA